MELEPVVVLAVVHVAGGVAAGPARAALGVGEEEGALEGAARGQGVFSKHGVHGAVARNVEAQLGHPRELGLVLAIA